MTFVADYGEMWYTFRGEYVMCRAEKRGDSNYEKSIEIFFDFSHIAGCDLLFGDWNVLSLCTVSSYR